jgi:flagellar hook protein FlgE
MTVTSSEGDGTSLRFGTTTNINEGYALESVTGSATATATSPLVLTLKDGWTISVTSSSTPPGPYAVGDNYADAFTTTPAQVPNGTKVRIELSDGTFHDDIIPTGTVYNIGDNYTYTSSGGTPITAQISQYATLTEITDVAKQTKITGVKYNDNTLVEEIIPGSVTASSTEALSLTFSDQTTQTVTSGTYNIGHSLPITTILNVYDSDGGVHAVPVYFTKTATGSGVTASDGNQWTINLDGSNVEGTSNTITDSSGTITVDMKPVTVQFSTSGQMLTGSGNIELTMTNGANHTQTVAIDVSQLTQFVGDSTFNGTTDGNPAGTLKSVSIDSSGIIQATYTNGVRQAEGQIAVAQFTNAAGLTKTGSSLYQASNNSGTPNVQTATALGCDITPSALEMSNVDIANEFSDMIITQRGFQSNSKIITVSDEMLETMINMKR